MRTAADDHDVIGPLEVALAAPHPLLSEYFKHASGSFRKASPDSRARIEHGKDAGPKA
jgi:hypothetical protein